MSPVMYNFVKFGHFRVGCAAAAVRTPNSPSQ